MFKERYFLALALMVTAFFSIGFHHPDEYYQIFEYMLVYSGKAHHSILSPIEMKYQMRPWFQPIFFNMLIKPLSWLGLDSPFHATLWLRTLTAFLAFFNFSLWMKWLHHLFPQKKCFHFLWWFLPYFAIRTSSDTWGAHLILTGLAFILLEQLRKDKVRMKTMLSFAILAGAAALFRYQTILITFPVVLWLLINKKLTLKTFLLPALTYAGVCLLELPFNYLGYAEWTWATFNHAYANVILKVSHQFGTMPPWGYFLLLLKSGFGIFGLFFIGGVLLYWKKQVKTLLGFTSIFYFIFFCFIGHKEVRFLTPLLFLAPVLLALAQNTTLEKIQKPLYRLNFLLLVVVLLKPANRYAGLYQALYQESGKGENVHVLRDDFDPTKSHLKFELEYFKKYKFQERVINTKAQLESMGRTFPNLLVATSKYKEFLLMKSMPHCQMKYSSYPQWLFKFNPFNWLSRSSILALWRCTLKPGKLD